MAWLLIQMASPLMLRSLVERKVTFSTTPDTSPNGTMVMWSPTLYQRSAIMMAPDVTSRKSGLRTPLAIMANTAPAPTIAIGLEGLVAFQAIYMAATNTRALMSAAAMLVNVSRRRHCRRFF